MFRGMPSQLRTPRQCGTAVPKARRRALHPLDEHRIEMLAIARELGLSGATDFDASEAFGISTRTLNTWKARDPEFAAALRIGKDIADGLVEATLFQKARGYSFRSEKIFQYEGQIVRAETVEHVPPSDTAIIFWLKNRQREKWRDVQDHKLQGEIDHKHTHTIEEDPRRLAIALLATLRAGMEASTEPLTIEGEAS